MRLLAARPPRPRLSAGRPAAARALATLLAASLAGCAPPSAEEDEGVSVEVVASPQPLTTGPARLAISVRDARGRPLEPVAVEVFASMSHPGMAPVLASARRAEPGEWRADLELTMAGDWFAEVEVRLADGGPGGGGSVVRTIELPGVRSR